MTPEEFDALSEMMSNHSNSSSHNALRLVLVNGISQSKAAKLTGVPHQSVTQKMKRARELHAAALVLAKAKMPKKRGSAE